ncbi:MAG: alpha-E domain-containing protein [Cyanobacteria bacterium J06627_8]
MLSRVADSIYWLNRYVERAENVARFVDVNFNLLLDAPQDSQQWHPLVVTTGDLTLFNKRYGEATADNVIHFLTFDKHYENSILSCLQQARENARSVREIISSEMWEQINEFYLMVKNESAGATPLVELPKFFADVKLASHLFAGIMDATMSHNEGWHFGQIGRLLERADKTTRILDVKYFILLPSVTDIGGSLDELQWISLLKSTSGYEMYRKCQHRISPSSVAQFLILDRTFPRSIQFCLLQAEQSLHQISGNPVGTWKNAAERSLGKMRAELDFITMDDIMDRGLHEFLNDIQKRLNGVGEGIFETFFDAQAIS